MTASARTSSVIPSRRGPSLTRAAGQVLLLTLGLLPGAAGCQRKAPGPQECVEFAEHWFNTDRRRVLQQPARSKHFDAKIQECLTKPFDRELVECVVAGGDNRRCERAYERRTAGAGREPELH